MSTLIEGRRRGYRSIGEGREKGVQRPKSAKDASQCSRNYWDRAHRSASKKKGEGHRFSDPGKQTQAAEGGNGRSSGSIIKSR